MNDLIQLPDAPNTDPQFAYYYGWGDVSLPANCFTLHTCPASGRCYLGQIATPQLNFNQDGLPALGNQTANLLQALAGDRIVRDVGVKEVFWYGIRLLKDVTDGTAGSLRRRPQIGARARQATEDEIIRFMKLRPIVDTYQVGTLIDADIAVCIDEWLLKHHVLVAGTTGCGKTNTLANIIAAAQAMGFHVIIYDHKPDYQHLHLPNEEDFDVDFYRRGLEDVSYWHLGGKARHAKEQNISVPACFLDPEVLGATICYQPSETNAAETLGMLLSHYAQERDDGTGKTWSLADFIRWLPSTAGELTKKIGFEINGQTYGAMRSRLGRPQRIPTWIDGAISSSSRAGLGLGHFALDKEVGPGNVTVIRIDNTANTGRAYGLFLSYILRLAYSLREHHLVKCPILHVIDEAQDIFNAGTTFKNAVGNMLDAQIRKGRSMRIGFVIAVQSAAAVPDDIRNLMNSRFIHRHNNHDQAREALEQASAAQIAMTDSFASGECFASIFGANALIHAQMRRSPFRITKEED